MHDDNDKLRRENKRLAAMNRELLDHIHSLQSENQSLKHQLDAMRRKIFGRSSEKINPVQLQLLFEDARQATSTALESLPRYASEAPDAEEPPKRKKGRGQAHPGRMALPAHLERVREEIHPEDRTCPCCRGQMKPMGEDVTEVLSRVPARFRVRQIVRVKYACPRCQDQIVRPELPAVLFEKSMASPEVVAEIAVSKFGDHLPLHRQAAIYKREGVPLDKATMCDWLGRGADLLAPVVQEMHRQALTSPVIQSDDTQVQYLDPGAGRPAPRGYLWTYVTRDQDVLFDFTTSRSREGPKRFLANYQGYLQVDGYAGYNEILATAGITHVACWAHARRKVYEARDSDPEYAAAALLMIKVLYDIEAEARANELDPEAIRELRQQKAVEVLSDLEVFYRLLQQDLLPQSPLGKAVSYALERWDALCEYTKDGRLEIDNNSAERSMRRVAVGRKNWLFAGSVAGGHRAAIYYSLLETCSRHGINPHAYLTDVLQRVTEHPNSRIGELTPRGWLAARTEAAAAS